MSKVRRASKGRPASKVRRASKAPRVSKARKENLGYLVGMRMRTGSVMELWRIKMRMGSAVRKIVPFLYKLCSEEGSVTVPLEMQAQPDP